MSEPTRLTREDFEEALGFPILDAQWEWIVTHRRHHPGQPLHRRARDHQGAPVTLRQELEATLDELNHQIEAVMPTDASDRGPRQLANPYLLQDTNGGYILVPLLTAKAQCLAALAAMDTPPPADQPDSPEDEPRCTCPVAPAARMRLRSDYTLVDARCPVHGMTEDEPRPVRATREQVERQAAALLDHNRALLAERRRYRLAWLSARRRAR